MSIITAAIILVIISFIGMFYGDKQSRLFSKRFFITFCISSFVILLVCIWADANEPEITKHHYEMMKARNSLRPTIDHDR